MMSVGESALFEASPLPTALVCDGCFVAVNNAFVQCFGWRRDEIVGQPTTLVVECLASAELRGRHNNGEARTLQTTIAELVLDGEPHTLAIFNDITTQRSSEERFRRAFDVSPMPQVMIRTSDRTFIAANDAFIETFGYSRGELLGRSTSNFTFYVRAGDRERIIERLGTDGRLVNEQMQLLTKSGTILDVVWSCVIVNVDGEPAVLKVAHDITELNRAVTAIRESEARFREIADNIRELFYVFDAKTGKPSYVSSAWESFTGYPVENAYTIDWSVLIHPEDLERVQTELAAQLASAQTYEMVYRMVHRDGSVRWVRDRSVPICDATGEVVRLVGVSEDITERKLTELALRDSETRFRDLAENIREVFWLTTPDLAQVLYISPGYELVWGRSCESLYANPLQWIEAIHPDDRARVDGAIEQSLRAGTYDVQYRIVRPDGVVRSVRDRAFPVRDERGTITRYAGVVDDITDQLALAEQLRQTQKLESLGMLAGGVAHDFNNLLAVIAASNGLLGEQLTSREDQELVAEVDAAVTRATGLTRQLLAFSRKQIVEPRVIDLNALVNETRKMMRRMVGEDVILTTSLEPELAPICVDPGYLVQVLMNLVVNARDAMPRGGSVALRTRTVTIDERLVRLHPNAKCGPAVMLDIADTGTGIPPETLRRIFEPFFTTKAQGRGTGMGLAVVHGIVEQAGGFIEVESSVGVGTTFHIYLPTVDGAAESAQTSALTLVHGCETIVLVDDDFYVRRATARALRARGYTVLEANDGDTALGLLHTPGIDLLLTDVVMPGIDGRQLAEAARRELPALRVLYMSGYTDDAVVRHGVMQGAVNLIEKPFRIDVLATKVRQVLDEPSAVA